MFSNKNREERNGNKNWGNGDNWKWKAFPVVCRYSRWRSAAGGIELVPDVRVPAALPEPEATGGHLFRTSVLPERTSRTRHLPWRQRWTGYDPHPLRPEDFCCRNRVLRTALVRQWQPVRLNLHPWLHVLDPSKHSRIILLNQWNGSPTYPETETLKSIFFSLRRIQNPPAPFPSSSSRRDQTFRPQSRNKTKGAKRILVNLRPNASVNRRQPQSEDDGLLTKL